MFANDRDLLVFEPELPKQVGWVGQRLVSGTGTIAGSDLTLSAQDVTFGAAGVGAGHVVLFDGTPYEVLARPSATVVTVSRIRPDPGGDPLPPSPASGKPVAVYTFAPQLGSAHAEVLGLLGVEPGDGVPGEGGIAESAITNPADLRRLECLAALRLIFEAATPAEGASRTSHEYNRADVYRDRFEAERQRVGVRLDLDGDGEADATRRLNVIQVVRD